MEKEVVSLEYLERRVRQILDRLSATRQCKATVVRGTHPRRETNWVVNITNLSSGLDAFASIDEAIAELQGTYVLEE